MKLFHTMLIILTCVFQLLSQTETFEDETAGSTHFTMYPMVFNTTGDIFVESADSFGCNGSDFWLGSGLFNGGSSGLVGGFTIAGDHWFMLSTSTPICVWTSNDDGNTHAPGIVEFVGTLIIEDSAYTVSEQFFIDPPSLSDWDMITFSPGIWSGHAVTSLEMNIISGINYVAIDDIAIESILLPIELLSFHAKISNKTVALSWSTGSEHKNEKFEIEQSGDGREFQKIGEVKGHGTTTQQQEYAFTDKSPLNGISYYRLKQIDFDGRFDYSDVISINFRAENGRVGEFYPNPSKSGSVNLDFFTQRGGEITISVFDMTGKLVINQIKRTANGNNDLSFDFSDLNTGSYIVKIRDEGKLTFRKFIHR